MSRVKEKYYLVYGLLMLLCALWLLLLEPGLPIKLVGVMFGLVSVETILKGFGKELKKIW